MFTFKRNQVIITVLVFMIAIAAYLNTKESGGNMQPNLVKEADTTSEKIAEETDFFEGYGEEISDLPPDDEFQLTEAMHSEDNKAVNPGQSDAKAAASTLAADVQSASAGNVSVKNVGALVPEKFEAIITKKDPIIAGVNENNKDNAVTVDKNLDVSYFVEEKMLREQARELQLEELKQYVANESLDKEAKSKAAANLLEIQERIEKESSAEALLRAKGFKEVYVRIDDNTVDVVVNKENLTESDIAQIEEIVNRKTGYSVGKIKITPLKGIIKEGEN